jgi:hypothetical protein
LTPKAFFRAEGVSLAGPRLAALFLKTQTAVEYHIESDQIGVLYRSKISECEYSF